jgi:HNH endonuclease
MAFSEDVIAQIWRRAGGRCECTRNCREHSGRRCNVELRAGQWHAHHLTAQSASGADTVNNGQALCVPCHENTRSYNAH